MCGDVIRCTFIRLLLLLLLGLAVAEGQAAATPGGEILQLQRMFLCCVWMVETHFILLPLTSHS